MAEEDNEKTIKQELKEYLEKDIKYPQNTKEEIIECFLWHRKILRHSIKAGRLIAFVVVGFFTIFCLAMLVYLFWGAL